jgi:hypothetical protein
MLTFIWCGVIAALIPNLSARKSRVVNIKFRPIYLPGINPGTVEGDIWAPQYVEFILLPWKQKLILK